VEFIDLKTQYQRYKAEIDAAIQTVLDHGAYIMGPEVKELEAQLAQYVGVKHGIAVASGTDALLIALMAYDIGPGDEVITTPFTWISTAEVIALLGAKPVFVDIDPLTYNIDVNQIEAAITPRTKAIMPVNLYGQLPDYTVINAIAAKHNLPVIEDAAQSFGATQNGRQSCGLSTIGATSFYPAKPLGCYGDGGALFTNDDALAAKMRAIRTHGGEVRHHHTYVGINGRFDTIQAAIVLVKLKYFNEELRLREKIAARYSQKLQGCTVVPIIAKGNTHSWAQYTIRVEDREALAKALVEEGIPTAIFYPKCVHEQPCFSYLGYKKGSFPVSEKASQEAISLPLHPWLTEETQDKICDKINEFAAQPVG
jgi:UDP-2-acetamido-2-deoxy-ribo-hexuluronate aminotransferase